MLLLVALGSSAQAEDWTGWGRTMQRNMVATEKWVPKVLEPGQFKPGVDEVDLNTAAGLRWVAKLGSQSYGNPTVAGGRVFIGTNNQGERRPGIHGDYSVVLALSEATGELQWQLTVPKLGSGKVNDWEYIGICSSPTMVDGVLYVVSSRGEVVALDPDGLADGNDGVQDEGAYMTAPGLPTVEVLPVDADILWAYDMPGELGVFPHNVTSSSVLVVGDRLYVTTSNGTDWSHLDLPSPFAPTLIVLDRHTGALLGEEASGLGERTMHANWSSPMFLPEPATVVFGAGDGFLYGFDPEPVVEDGLKVLHKRWWVDANKPGYRMDGDLRREYPTAEGPSEIISTPVYAEGRVYVAIGQDPEHGPGVGLLSAVDPKQDGERQALWTYDGIGRTISTVAVYAGVVYAADYDGRLHALDAATGELLWVHDTHAHLWGSPVVISGRVYLGDEDGVLSVFKAGRKLKLLREIAFPAPIYSSPVVANGSLYVATQTHLYAFDGQK